MTNQVNTVIGGGGPAVGEDAVYITQKIAASSDLQDITPAKNAPRVPRLYLASVNAPPAAPPTGTGSDGPVTALLWSLLQSLMEGFAAYASLYPGAFTLDSHLTNPTSSLPEKRSSSGDGLRSAGRRGLSN